MMAPHYFRRNMAGLITFSLFLTAALALLKPPPPLTFATSPHFSYLPHLSSPAEERAGCAVAIMPVGDSITQGYGDPQMVGYRQELYNALVNEGYIVNFAGSRRDGLPLDFDRDNESHPAQEAYFIRDNILTYLSQNQPDIILLHIGTNGVGDKGAEVVAQEIDEILDRIYGFDSKIMVFLARIINRVEPIEKVRETSKLNELIQQLADERIKGGDPLAVVDMEPALTYFIIGSDGQVILVDMVDTKHPNRNGYKKMAAVWNTALQEYLHDYCQADHAPRFTAAPRTTAYAGVPYQPVVEASGNPVPRFSLSQAPPGMTIDRDSGSIAWSPAAAGDFVVTARAANGVNPPAEQTFTIHVAEESVCPAETTVLYHLDEAAAPFADALGGPPALCSNCPASTSGQVGQALRFDGHSTGLAVAAGGNLFDWGEREDFSLEFWLRRPGSCAGSTSEFNEVVAGRADLTSNMAWWVGLSCQHQGKARFVLRDSDSDANDTASVVSQSVLTGGDWHHVAVVRDGTALDIRLYVDGALEGIALADFSSGFESDSAALDIGWFNLGQGFHFDGAIDEVAVYNRTLADSEIQQHYASAHQGNVYCRVSGFSD